MIKNNLPLLLLFLLSACSKSKDEFNVTPVAKNYIGEAKLFGLVSCLKIEGGEIINVTTTGKAAISVAYVMQGSLPGFVPFPPVNAKLTAYENNIYFFTVDPLNNEECRVWSSDDKTYNGIHYNIAFFPNDSIDAHMGYFSYKIPQGEQYFEFKGKKNN